MPEEKVSAASTPSNSATVFFRGRIRRIAIPRIKMIAVGGAHHLFIVGDFKGRSLVDGRGQRPVLFIQIRRAAHRLSSPVDGIFRFIISLDHYNTVWFPLRPFARLCGLKAF